MYITKANFKKIIYHLDIPEGFKFDDMIIWTTPKGVDIKYEYNPNDPNLISKMFSYREKASLLAFKALCKGDECIIEYIYNKIEKPIDSLLYVQPEKSPAYHTDPNCPAMKSDYERIIIPLQIREQGKDKVLEFRKYWNDNNVLRELDNEAFCNRINLRFQLNPPIRGWETEIRSNSGIQIVEDNRSVSEINDDIVEIYKELTTYLKAKKGRIALCEYYGYLSWKGDTEEDVVTNYKLPYGCTQEDLKQFLSTLHAYKMKMSEQLQELYMRKYIPDLNVDDSLLKSLGFEPCYICAMHNGEHNHEERT